MYLLNNLAVKFLYWLTLIKRLVITHKCKSKEVGYYTMENLWLLITKSGGGGIKPTPGVRCMVLECHSLKYCPAVPNLNQSQQW